MKKAMVLFIAACLALGPALWISADDGSAPETPSGAACPVAGAARELGLLVLGIGWEAVRIVLPDWCPAKDKDIDGLLEDASSNSPSP